MFRRWEAKTGFFIAGATIVALVCFNYLGWLGWLKNAGRSIWQPFMAKTSEINISLGDRYAFFKSKEDFFQAYRACETGLAKEKFSESRLKLLEDENLNLKQLLNFREKNNFTLATARVVGRNAEGTEKTVVIDRGEEDGLKINQPVLAGEGILVGKIAKTEKGIAVVRLLNDSQSKAAAMALNREKSLGVVEGGYGLSVRMNFIPRNEVIMVGDQIITSGLEENIPRGLLIGEVAAVENETYRPFQEAVLTPAVDLSKLFWLDVLLTY